MHDPKFGVLLPGDDYAAAKQAALQAESEGFYSVSISTTSLPRSGHLKHPFWSAIRH